MVCFLNAPCCGSIGDTHRLRGNHRAIAITRRDETGIECPRSPTRDVAGYPGPVSQWIDALLLLLGALGVLGGSISPRLGIDGQVAASFCEQAPTIAKKTLAIMQAEGLAGHFTARHYLSAVLAECVPWLPTARPPRVLRKLRSTDQGNGVWNE